MKDTKHTIFSALSDRIFFRRDVRDLGDSSYGMKLLMNSPGGKESENTYPFVTSDLWISDTGEKKDLPRHVHRHKS